VRRLLFWLGLVLCLAVPNAMVAMKERSLRGGRTVLLRLAPADPRSIMQGDYMRLNYADLPSAPAAAPEQGFVSADADTQGVLSNFRFGAGGPVRIRYRLEHGYPRIATDAFYFEEGQAKRYEPAAYGKFHLSDAGDLTLRSLVDAEFRDLGGSAKAGESR
jgi:uncharacterized membrane-anchored protein